MEKVLEKAKQWLSDTFDQNTRAPVKKLLNNNTADWVERFYKDLEYGTGGMRGIVGPGTNRIS